MPDTPNTPPVTGSGMESAVYDAIAAVLTYEISDSAYLNRICRKAAAAAKPHLEAELADTVARLEGENERLREYLARELGWMNETSLTEYGDGRKASLDRLCEVFPDLAPALDTEP